VTRILLALVALFLLAGQAQAEVTETVTYFHTDGLGSVIAASDESGNLLWRERYRPFGNRLEKAVTTDEHALYYTGKPHDDTTGLTYFGARHYDPVVGRFMGIDPVGVDPGNIHSFNRYAYANNNPYKYVDRDGRSSIAVQFTDQPINSPIGTIPQLISGGHSGVIVINDKTGLTRYREFGRYNGTSGMVRGSLISNFSLEPGGVPTVDSIGTVLREVMNIGQRAGSVDIDVRFKYGGDFDAMMKEVGQWHDKTWSLFGSTCHSFCDEVVDAGGGKGASVSGTLGKDNTGLINRIRDAYPENSRGGE